MVSQGRKTFVIQLEPVDAAALEPALRGWVEELDTGSSTQFTSSTALLAFLVSALRRPGTPPTGSKT
jgi:hypothetical protein